MTVYLWGLTNGSDTTNEYGVMPEAVTVAMDEAMARSVVTTMENLRRHYAVGRNRTLAGDVYFELFQKEAGGRRYFIAKVSCVSFVGGLLANVLAKIGDCPLVK